MDMKEIRQELKVVLEDIYSWCGINKGLPEDEIRRRELVLWKQSILYKIKDAKINRNKKIEDFNTELFYLINSFLSVSI
jgi:hypothetical protein